MLFSFKKKHNIYFSNFSKKKSNNILFIRTNTFKNNFVQTQNKKIIYSFFDHLFSIVII